MTPPNTTSLSPRLTFLAVALATTSLLSGCVAMVVGGAVGTAMAVTDRRSTGTQIEDQLIELKARNRAREVLPDSGNVSTTSYNRVLLLTGEVPTEANRAAIEETTSKIDNVKSVVNELAVRDASTFSSRSSDTVVTSKVKATFAEARVFPINAVKVVTERGVVYLMGRVLDAEGNKAAELARGVGGVMKVVKVFEPITQTEVDSLKAKENVAAPDAASAPVK
jgi:osmotically-inducible protein OsmY